MFGLVVMIACIIFFVKAAESEGKSGITWGAMSLLVWFFTPIVFPSYLLCKIGGQVALFVTITLFRVVRNK